MSLGETDIVKGGIMEKHDKQGIKSNVHIVLRGPDGQIKDERRLGEKVEPKIEDKEANECLDKASISG